MVSFLEKRGKKSSSFFRYTSQQGTLGNVFGANDYWVGMGIMLDSFDNDGQKNNPFVSLMINDGTRSYDHVTDGSQQILTGIISSVFYSSSSCIPSHFRVSERFQKQAIPSQASS